MAKSWVVNGWRLQSAMAGIAVLCAAVAHAETSDHWAFRPVVRPDVLTTDNTIDPIDRFISLRLEAEGLEPAPRADAATLLRRVYFVLTGLPPTVEELEAFLADPSDKAYAQVVDRLLASPEFGERWGRHWLDVARFAESSGGGRSLMFPHAWRYRDYVIAAFNDDLPFDRFIIEQLAGDQLPADTPAERDRLKIATGFLTLGAINYELQDKDLLEMEIADEQCEAVGRAFLGLSVGCARCHDHKFDPISQHDYYGMAGIFTSTNAVVHANVGAPYTTPLEAGEDVAAYQQAQAKIKSLKGELTELESIESDSDAAQQIDPGANDSRKKQLQADIKQLEKDSPRQPKAMAVVDRKQVGDLALRIGGVADLPGEIVPRAFLPVAGGNAAPIPDNRSGRLELARWIASPDNRLTSRVIANRVWHHCMGEGLVQTPDDFGTAGREPSHPELLDHLAASLIDDHWPIKKLVRRIVLSATFQRSSRGEPQAVARDPENKYLARAHLRQLDAEAIRDSLLAISGLLDSSRGGPTIRKVTEYDYDYKFESRQRSVYVPRFRSEQLDAFEIFDGANPNCVTGRRNATQLATQALFMLNSPLVIESAGATADRLLEKVATHESRIDHLFRMAVGRGPSNAERTAMQDYLATSLGSEGVSELQAYGDLCQLLFCSIDFRFLR